MAKGMTFRVTKILLTKILPMEILSAAVLSSFLLFPASAQADAPAAREAFGKTAEADIALAQAEAAATAGNADEARHLFRYARQMNPDDSEVWFQSARFEIDQKNFDAAIALLDQSLTRDRDNFSALYERAYLFFLLGKEDEAKAAFAEYASRVPDDKRPSYFLGVYAFKRDDLKVAQVFFTEASSGTDSVAAYARCYAALIAAQLEQPSAKDLAQQALGTVPTEEWRAKLKPLAEGGGGGGSTRRLPWINGVGHIGVEYDTNAPLAPLSAAKSPTTSPVGAPIAGFRLTEDIKLVFRPIAIEPFTLELEGDFYNANHLNKRTELAQYDNGGPAADVRMVTRWGSKLKFEGSLDLTYRDVWFNDYKQRFLTGLGIFPQAGLLFAPRHFLYAVGMIENRNFHDTGAQAGYARDGWTTMAGLLYQVPFSILEFNVIAGYDQDNTSGYNYFFQGGHLGGGLRLHALKNLAIYGFAAGNIRSYAQAQPKRLEEQGEFGGNVRWDIIRHLAVIAAYSYLFNNAYTNTAGKLVDYSAYTYNHHLITFNVEAYF